MNTRPSDFHVHEPMHENLSGAAETRRVVPLTGPDISVTATGRQSASPSTSGVVCESDRPQSNKVARGGDAPPPLKRRRYPHGLIAHQARAAGHLPSTIYQHMQNCRTLEEALAMPMPPDPNAAAQLARQARAAGLSSIAGQTAHA